MRGGVLEHPLAVQQGEYVGDHQEAVGRILVHRGKGIVEIVGFAHPEGLNRHAKLFRCCIGGAIAQGHTEIVGVPQHRDLAQARHGFLHQLQPFRREFGGDFGYAGHIAARTREARRQMGGDRVPGISDDDRNARMFLGCQCGGVAECNQQLDMACHQLADELRQQVHLSLRGAALKDEIGSDCVPAFCKRAAQSSNVRVSVGERQAGTQEPDAGDFARLLSVNATRDQGESCQRQKRPPLDHKACLAESCRRIAEVLDDSPVAGRSL